MSHKLLLADDSVTIQRVIELTFADEDIEVIAVGDGQQAMSRIETERPDVVLADVGMPERDGYEVAAFVKARPDLSHIPVVLLTGAFEPIDESKARAVGCDGVLVKPFEPQMVINRVRDLLAGRRPASLWTVPSTQSATATRLVPAPAPTPVQAPARPVHTAPGRSSSPDFAFMDEEPPPAPRNNAGGGDPLDAYFDQLDAAFGNPPPPPLEEVAPGRPSMSESSTAVENEDWDVGLQEPEPEVTQPEPEPEPPPRPFVVMPPEPARPTPVEMPEVRMRSEAAAPPAEPLVYAPQPETTPPAAVAPAPPPSLADAFAALLAAEQGQAHMPHAPGAPAGGGAISDDVIEEVVKRVLARLSDRVVRETVLDIAERLVRQEIDRIKRTST